MGYSDGSIHKYIDYKLTYEDILDIVESTGKYFKMPHIKAVKTKPLEPKRDDESKCSIA